MSEVPQTAPAVPFMPEVVARYYAGAVKASALKVHRRWGRVFTAEDLTGEAWCIALVRWQLWSDQIPLARKDLEIHLHHWVDAQLKARGWDRVTVDGRRRWQQPAVSETLWSPDWVVRRLDQVAVGDSDPVDDEECELSLSPDWAPMGRRKRERFARILFQRYPVLVADFEAVDSTPKPSKLSHAVWERQQERKRAQLRVRYAQELATARYEVEGFGHLGQLEAAA